MPRRDLRSDLWAFGVAASASVGSRGHHLRGTATNTARR